MDLHMDVMDGFEAVKIIRERDAEIPVFALTADVIGDTQKRCRDAGFTRIISKPYNPSELIGVIRETLHVSAEPSIPILDSNRGIHLVGDNPELYRKMLQVFLQEIIEETQELGTLIERHQWKELGDLAHKIKGGAASIGAERLARRTKMIQVLASQRAADIGDYMGKLRQDIDDLVAESRVYLGK
jgi:HPt (histidine-containing phosphotransfer) domain-containing protein